MAPISVIGMYVWVVGITSLYLTRIILRPYNSYIGYWSGIQV